MQVIRFPPPYARVYSEHARNRLKLIEGAGACAQVLRNIDSMESMPHRGRISDDPSDNFILRMRDSYRLTHNCPRA
jgi:hypothetical protein